MVIPSRGHRVRGCGFTLIELLVVIAVIALLIGILLPALGKARREGWKSASMANCRSIGQAGAMYQDANKGELPIVPTGVPVPTTVSGWMPFTSWGKFASTYYLRQGGIFDIAPDSRPLNPYLTSERLPSRAEALADPTVRATFQMPALRDPSDKIGHQQAWAFSSSYGPLTPNADRSTCYNDAGTSYVYQSKWFFQTANFVGGNWSRAFTLGTARLKIADAFVPARMIWVNDEMTDVVMHQPSDTARIRNGYGDINKGVVTFLDGHTKYINIIPGGNSNGNATFRPWLVPAFNNA